MPRIPRTEANVDVAYANQPTMSPDALTGPGRALQGLGRAIAGLGSDFAAAAEINAQPTEEERFQANLALVRFQNEQDLAEANRQATFSGDPEGYSDTSVGEFDEKRNELLESLPDKPAIRNQAMLHTERMRGSRYERAFGFERQQKHGRLISQIDETASQEVAMAEPGQVEQITTKIRGIDMMIDAAPGLSPAEKNALRDKMSAQALNRILEGTPDDRKLDVADDLIKKWTSELEPIQPGQGPQQGMPGSPSGPAVDRTGFKPDLRSDLGGSFDQSRIFFDRAPTKTERAQIFKTGGVVVNLDTNWAKGDRPTTPMVVIPDQATAAQRQAAEAYARGVSEVYKQQFGVELKPKVLTRSENGRGRGFTIHTEPYSVNDSKAVEFFNSPEGRRAHAQLLGDTFGKIPGVHFSIPHDPDRGDYGAHGSGGNEVKFARALLEDIRGGGKAMALGAPGSASDTGEGLKVEATAYSPQKGGDKMEGGYAAARPGPDGKAEVRTLADVAAGRSQYVTVAGAKEQFGKTYTIPEISFVDKDGKTQTLKNVKAVVHDTGSAFKGAKEGRFDIPIDRDASDKQMQASHGLWKQAGLRFLPEGQKKAEAPKGVQVADASGAIPQSASMARGENAIPSAPGEPQAIQPVRQPSVRGSVIEKLLQMRPALVDAQNRAIGAMIEGAEKSAGEGYHLPDPQRAALRERVMSTGNQQMLQRLDAAEAAADYTTQLRTGNLDNVKGEAQRLREELNQNGGTPEFIARVKAVEGLAATMEKSLSDDSIGWAEKAGMPPVEPITPDNFDVDTLLARKAVADGIGEKYGMQYRQFFRNGEEKAQLEAAFTKGGDDMVNMLATMYEAFGDDTPKAVSEIAPKNPEAAHAAYLVATGGDPKAVKDVAETILRRREEGYAGAPKIDNAEMQSTFRDAAGSLSGADKRTPGFFENMGLTSGGAQPPPTDRKFSDKILATARAIYEARVQDPATYDDTLMEESIRLALGERSNASGQVFGGALSQKGEGWENPYVGGNTVLIPSTIRKDMFNVVIDAIDDKDLIAAGHPLPADRMGNPIPIQRVLSYGEFRQAGAKGQYAIWRHVVDPIDKSKPGYIMTAPAPKQNPNEISTTDIVASAKLGGGDTFVLDLEKLTPILRERMPSAFWKE